MLTYYWGQEQGAPDAETEEVIFHPSQSKLPHGTTKVNLAYGGQKHN